ncbi:MAG: 5-formyltetrahydrofolate cyclo-ligase [Sulfuricurvum sp.]|uniref:5-formyltetrahydrofolate cyclo-ligase n=1 Tax=Sulfuricurvum sp. TaxID=2025608 RepID=UPI002630C3B2|nr:5-formyltetrahydrofolate cyclo-ligase [Sulfuricurvum sp.]MDD5161140.1 5-formyltetrahydrofolate cyclo-ligase [Sulfuricurvum sp.]
MTKSDFRAYCLDQIKNANVSTKNYRDERVRMSLAKVLKKLGAKRILAFWPMGFEADIRKTITASRMQSEVYLPFMDGVSFKMVPFRYPLERKAFGIYEPRDSYRKYNLIDVAIVPVVGVDGSLRRIGFGKGMYDRFFPTLKSKPFTIFIQSCACQTTQKVCDDYDVQGDLLITSHGVQSMRNTNVERTTRRGRSRSHQRVSRIFNFKKDYRRTF